MGRCNNRMKNNNLLQEIINNNNNKEEEEEEEEIINNNQIIIRLITLIRLNNIVDWDLQYLNVFVNLRMKYHGLKREFLLKMSSMINRNRRIVKIQMVFVKEDLCLWFSEWLHYLLLLQLFLKVFHIFNLIQDCWGSMQLYFIVLQYLSSLVFLRL